MSLLWLLCTMGVVGGGLWLINRRILGDGRKSTLLNGVVLVLLVLWMLYSFGHFTHFAS